MPEPAAFARRRPNPALGWALGLFVGALLLRLLGIGWGLPNAERHWSLHPDEPIVWGYAQQLSPAHLDFDPGFYNYGTLYLTLVNVSTSVVNAYGGGPASNTPEAQAEALGRYHLVGRLLSALAGAGLAWVVFALLLRVTNVFGAAFGGAAMAVAPALVVHSRFQTVDLVATLFLALSLVYATKLAEAEEGGAWTRDAALAGLFAGLSAGTKYSGVLALLAVAAALVLARRRCTDFPLSRLCGVALGCCVAAFIATTPGALKNPARFWQDFRYEMQHVATGHGLVFEGTPSGFVFHLHNLSAGFGFLLLLLGLAGLIAACRRGRSWAWALAAFGLATYVLIGRAEVKFMRYTFPLMPVLAVGAGWLVGQAHQHPNRRWRIVGGVGLFALGGLGGGGMADSGLYTYWMAGQDPRDTAGQWLREYARGAKVGFVADPWFYSATLFPQAAAPRSAPFAARDAAMRAVQDPKLVRYVPPDPATRLDWDPRLLTHEVPDFVVFSSFEFDDLDRLRRLNATDPKLEPFLAFGKALSASYEAVRAFGEDARGHPLVHDMMYIRPTLWVWKRRAGSMTPSSPSSTTSSLSEAPPSTR